MKAPFIAWALAGAILGSAAATAWARRSEQTRDRGAALQREQIRSQRDGIESEADRLRSALAALGSPDTLQGAVRRFRTLRTYNERLQLEERRLRAKLEIPDEPLWPTDSIVRPAAEWKYAGQASPAATIESVLAVARSGDVDRLSSLIAFEAPARAEAEATFNQLPEAARAEYGSSEKVIATLIAGQMPTDYAAMAVIDTTNPDPGSAVITVRLETGDGAQRDLKFKLQQNQGAWQLDVPSQEVTALAAGLTGPGPR